MTEREPSDWKWRVTVALVGGLLIGIIIGAVLGAHT